MDRSRRELNALIAEADRVVADCGRYLEAAEELVEGVPRRRAVVEERLAAAREMLEQADKELKRVRKDDDAGWVDDASWAEEREAQWARDQASRKVFRIQWYELSSDDFDLENRKAVARQVAGLLREEAEQRLDAIAGRDENPELRGAVAERKDEVFRTTRYLTRKYAEARSLQHDEVMTARAEAHNILDRLKNPSAGP